MTTREMTVDQATTLIEQEAAAIERIKRARAILGDEVVILGHHYQRDEVVQFADFQGDSYQLSEEGAKVDAKYIVFAGVHFMAESAAVLGRADQVVILPNLQAGCSMADMANLEQVLTAWDELEQVLGGDPAAAHHADHLHEQRRQPESLRRRARRHGLHLVQCARRARLGVRAARESLLLPRSASRTQHRQSDGHPARPDGALESRTSPSAG